MALIDKIIKVYLELAENDCAAFSPDSGLILLQDDQMGLVLILPSGNTASQFLKG